MVTIDNYSFILVGNNRMRLAKPNEMNDLRRKIIIVGTLRIDQENKKNQVLEVQSYEKTYIIGSYNSYNSTYYLGKKSKEMKEFEQMVRENVPVVTNFKIGYAYRPERIGKHIPCIIGKVTGEIEEKIIFVESQNFETNTITDIKGKKYFVDWLSMNQYQHRNLTTELHNMPIKLKKFFGVFCEKGLKIDMISLKDSLPILGVAGAFKIR